MCGNLPICIELFSVRGEIQDGGDGTDLRKLFIVLLFFVTLLFCSYSGYTKYEEMFREPLSKSSH
jgi:hypothetical protein